MRLSALATLTLALLAGCQATTRVYDECMYGSDTCEPGTGCYQVTSGRASAGYCTLECQYDTDCPYDVRGYRGRCYSFDGALTTCVETCSGPLDCANGWHCDATYGACLPK
jgi:hypothetical protein